MLLLFILHLFYKLVNEKLKKNNYLYNKQTTSIIINMYYYEVAPCRIVRKDVSTFVYQLDNKLDIGSIVEISIGKLFLKAVVISETSKPKFETKTITKVFNIVPIPEELIKSVLWLSDYYKNDLCQLINSLLPKNIERKRRKQSSESVNDSTDRTKILLNKFQKRAVSQLTSFTKGSAILQGITGSGKTLVYFDIIEKTIKSGRSAILLIPEISLTPQLISQTKRRFQNIIVYNSSLTEAKKYNAWFNISSATKPVLIVGTRSSLFLPIKDLGLIILDESHDQSYIQDSSPRYSSLRLASVLGKMHSSKVIFGSATPSVSELFLAKSSDSQIVKMDMKAIPDAKDPIIEIVDMKKSENKKGSSFLSKSLLSAITESLNNKKQVILYHNRRGNHGLTICDSCGWQVVCVNCNIPLVLYKDNYQLQCRLCNYKIEVPKSCSNCHKASIIHKIFGTKQIEDDLSKLFPQAVISRFDGDNTKSDSLSIKYDELHKGQIDIAIGTQILAKGLDLPNLNLVGIVQAENGMSLPDYSSRERIFQLLYQVVGRVGRNSNSSKVVVQTYNPDDETIIYGVNQDYEKFYNFEIKNRESGRFPPFMFILKLTCKYKTEKGAIQASKNMIDRIKKLEMKDIQLIGPMPAFYEKIRESYRWQIILKSKNRRSLQYLSSKIKDSNWQIDLDPSTLL